MTLGTTTEGRPLMLVLSDNPKINIIGLINFNPLIQGN